MTIDQIAAVVSEHTNISIEKMRSGVRKREIVYAMHIVMYLCKLYTRANDYVIGGYFDRDRTSVPHAFNKIQGFLDVNDEETHTLIDRFSKQLKQAA